MPLIQYSEANIKADRLDLIERANEIIEEYQRQGFTLTLRQLYYQHVARGLIPNTERSYKNLGNLINDGRMAGLIDWYAIEDRGRGTSSVYVQEEEQECLNGIQYHYSLDYWARQETHVEVWVEKEALASVIQRTADKYKGAVAGLQRLTCRPAKRGGRGSGSNKPKTRATALSLSTLATMTQAALI